ncbi:MAG: hypothetical protein ACE15D_04035 [Candidatus Eisenbacteria bacterium]|nr:hypothetical protein [Candidatus Eisenbacteria bacterium]
MQGNAQRERFLAIPILFGIGLAAVAGTSLVFYQTRIANPSVGEYFSFINIGRLLVITHVHLFGYSTMGFVLYTLGRRLGAARGKAFGTILGVTVIVGILDVLSWWAVIYVSPTFRFLTFAAGGGFVSGILFSCLLVLIAVYRFKDEEGEVVLR